MSPHQVAVYQAKGSEGLKELKATNEQQDNGAVILHLVAHYSIDQV